MTPSKSQHLPLGRQAPTRDCPGWQLAKSARDYEDRKWALRFVVDDISKRMPEMAAAMQPNLQRKMADAKRQLRNAPEKIVEQELAEYRSAIDDGDEDGEHSEAG